MKAMKHALIGLILYAVCLAAGCGQGDLLGEMKKIVPIYEGARISESYTPTEKMSVIKMEIEASTASQKDILNFYEDAMTNQGWILSEVQDYGKDGSVMELTKKDFGTLTIQTITKKTEDTGIIPVVLNLTIE